MGLDVSHDAFHGAYSAFNTFRKAVAWAAGGCFPPYYEEFELSRLKEIEAPDDKWKNLGLRENAWWFVPDAIVPETHPGLYEFLGHSDCDGQITPEMCVKVADDLEKLIPEFDRLPYGNFGHILRNGGFKATLFQFIIGCRAAAAANEPLDFH